MGWKIMPQPPYSPKLTPSDFHLFGPLKGELRGHHFETDDGAKRAVREWVEKTESAFFFGQGLCVGPSDGRSAFRQLVTALRAKIG